MTRSGRLAYGTRVAQLLFSALLCFSSGVASTGENDGRPNLSVCLPERTADPEPRRQIPDLGAGDQAGAVQILRRITQMNPSDAGAYQALSQALAREGDLAEAAAVLEEAADRATTSVKQLLLAAAALRERRLEYGQAILDYRTLLRVLPQEQAAALGREIAPHLAYLAQSTDIDTSSSGEPMLGGPDTDGPGGLPGENVKPRPGSTLTREQRAILIPGGLDLLARTLAVDTGVLKEADAVERIFSFILEVEPPGGGRAVDNPLISAVVLYLRHYEALLRYLRKEQLIPKESDHRQGYELVVPLTGDRETVSKTRRLLRFFGVDYDLNQARGGSPGVKLSLKQDRVSRERQDLLHNMGVNLLDRGLNEIRLSLKDATLPILFDEATLAGKILGKKDAGGRTLLESLVREPACMRLYAALASCSQSARSSLVKHLDAFDLRQSSDLISAFGAQFDFRGDRLHLPGSSAAWESLLGSPFADYSGFLKALLTRDKGRALRLYVALSTAPRSIQEYFGASAEGLQQLYLLIPESQIVTALKSPAEMWRVDIGRLLRLLSADQHGLWLSLDSRFVKYLWPARAGSGGRDPASKTACTHVSPSELKDLLGRGFSSKPASLIEVIEILELLHYVQVTRPELLTGESVEAIMENPHAASVYLDLVWDIDPDAHLLAEYLRYCARVAGEREKGWNINRTRTSQAIFFLLSALRRQEILGAGDARALLAKALGVLSSADEAAFAMGVAGFVSGELNRVLEKSLRPADGTVDLLMMALAGQSRIREFTSEGKKLKYDMQGRVHERFTDAVQHQAFVPLSRLLHAYRVIRQAVQDASGGTSSLSLMLDALGGMQAAQFPPGSSWELRIRTAHCDLDTLRAKLDSSLKRGPKNGDVSRLVMEIAAELDTELSVTLLTYCYAISGTPETDVLAFDPLFVRKHSFYEGGAVAGGWPKTSLKQNPELGAYFAGSLSGLSFQLCLLETAQAVQSFGKREGRHLVPTMISGIRAVRPSRISDHAQEYVALAAGLGREVIAMSARDSSVRQWCLTYLEEHLPPPRRDRVAISLDQPHIPGAVALLSPSELFFLGQSYLADVMGRNADDARPGSKGLQTATGLEGDVARDRSPDDALSPPSPPTRSKPAPPRFFSPALDRLTEILSDAKTYGEEQFSEEINQYGILLSRRLGLTQLTLAESDSYELLQATAHPQMLYERICDLKVRLAEIDYSLGLPAELEISQGELAVRDILPRSAPVFTNTWKLALDQIKRLSTGNALAWIEELLNEGILIPAGDHEKSK